MPNKLLFLITEDKWFLTHRLPLANMLKENGYEVVVVTKVTKYKQMIEDKGFRVVPLSVSRRGVNPFRELMTLWRLNKIYKSEKPDYVHHIGIKNIINGSLIARLHKVPHVVNAFAGLGLVFSNPVGKVKYVRSVVVPLLRLLLRKDNIVVIFQNPDDAKLLLDLGVVVKKQAALIRSSGVNLKQYMAVDEPDEKTVTVVMAGRLLWAKGVGILAEAARSLKEGGYAINIQLVGAPDPDNLSSVQEEQLREWQSQGIIEWLGYQEDMVTVWKNCHIAVLPSFYGEGVPKVLLEAAACGRPLIATDSTGCREIAVDGLNAITVPPRDAGALAEALVKLSADKVLRERMGRNSRKLVEEHFSDSFVASQTLALYRSMGERSEAW